MPSGRQYSSNTSPERNNVLYSISCTYVHTRDFMQSSLIVRILFQGEAMMWWHYSATLSCCNRAIQIIYDNGNTKSRRYSANFELFYERQSVSVGWMDLRWSELQRTPPRHAPSPPSLNSSGTITRKHCCHDTIIIL